MLGVRKAATLSPETLDKLASLQGDVDSAGAYDLRVAKAKSKWSSVKKDTGPWLEIKQSLTKMCWGHRRCAYCEDSVADEIEHVRPKDLYPEAVFVWENYLYACGPCNGPKGNRFAVVNADGTYADVARKAGAAVVPPPLGDPALLDPRIDDPLEYLVLDIRETFLFRPRPRIASDRKQRAQYTIELLNLNGRAYLVEGRRTAYETLVIALESARTRKQNGDPLDGPVRVVGNIPHRSVWEEMKRQASKIAPLASLFGAVPEAAQW